MILSIRTTLLLLLFLTLLLAIAMNSVLATIVTHHEVNEVFDAELALSAKIIKGLLSEGNLADDLPRIAAAFDESLGTVQSAQPELEAYERTRLIQIWRQDGSELLFRSPGAPQYALAPMHKGYYHHDSQGQEWMVYVTDLPTINSWLMVGEYPYGREEISENLGSVLLMSGMVALIFCTLIALAAIEYGLYPLRELATSLKLRSLTNLSPVTLLRNPIELQPVIDDINKMFRRMQQGLDSERRFIADAAHELRTPLSVIKLQTQTLQRQNIATMTEPLQQLEASVDRSTRVIEQLLLLAQLDHPEHTLQATLQDIVELSRITLAHMHYRAEKAGCDLSFHSDNEVVNVMINSTLFDIALSNLLGNAVRYGAGQPIQVSLTTLLDHYCVCVRDLGPGVHVDELEHIQQRFYRVDGLRGDGAGLGLSIVSRIMEVHGGYLDIYNHPAGGLAVSLYFLKA